ncbi:MAG: NRDE family protein [Planctomycetota bacterium]
MCTLTWHDASDGYQIFFNRDERRERKPEMPPAIRRCGDTRFVAPLDGDHHGTWIAVNEYGLSVCLLNGFPAAGARDREEYTSRGRLPMTAIGQRSTAGVATWLRTVDLARYRPFVLVVFEPENIGLLAQWSGVSIDVVAGRPHEQPLVSSSFYTEQVRRSRTAVFRDLMRPGSALSATHLEFHRSHRPSAGPHSPCMHRDEAATVSFSRIDVCLERVCFHYAPNSPCRGLPDGPAVVLARRVPTGSPATA